MLFLSTWVYSEEDAERPEQALYVLPADERDMEIGAGLW